MCSCGKDTELICSMFLIMFGISMVGETTATSRHRTVQFEHFDDYLVSTLGTRSRVFNQVLKVEPQSSEMEKSVQVQNGTTDAGNDTVSNSTGDSSVSNSSQVSNDTPQQHATMSTDELLGYFRDVPRQHWSCCMLGKLAGNKGFHCFAGFYVERLQTRNRNRVQNAQMVVDGVSLRSRYAANVMRTFERCVENHASEFHKCCYAATLERMEVSRWERYRRRMSRS